jgi:Kef-type K+ transport system membrane component KefB
MEAILLPLALVLIAAEVGGYISDRLGLTRVAGPIAAGLFIGPSLLGVVRVDGNIEMLAGVGALCVLAIAGLETDLAGIRAVGRPALLAAVGGVMLPFVLGAGVTRALGYGIPASLFAGAILTATSVGVTCAALRELGLFRSRAGQTIIGAAVIDDILGLMVLAIVIAAETGAGSTAPLAQFGAMFGVLAGAAVAVYFLRGHLASLLHQLHLRGGGLAGLVGLVLIVAWVFQTVGGLAGITGAYVAGAALAGSHVADGLRDRLVHAGEAFAIPVFLVAIGLSVDLHQAPGVLVPMLALLAVGVGGKLIGSGLGARLGGLDRTTSVGVGIGMIARGEVALVAASLGLKSGVIDQGLYAAAVVMALGTTVITPVLLSLWANRPSFATIRSDVVAPGGMLVAAMPGRELE